MLPGAQIRLLTASPGTGPGQTLAALIMILGYSIIVVPTGIVTAELTSVAWERKKQAMCPECASTGHDKDAVHCKHCGERLEGGADS